MSLSVIGSIASIVSLVGAVISGVFATKSVTFYLRTTRQYKYTTILSKSQSLADETREYKWHFRGNKENYKNLVSNLDKLTYELPLEKPEIKEYIETLISRINGCINREISIKDLDEELEQTEGRTVFKDVGTIFREIIDGLKKEVDFYNNLNTKSSILKRSKAN